MTDSTHVLASHLLLNKQGIIICPGQIPLAAYTRSWLPRFMISSICPASQKCTLIILKETALQQSSNSW